MIRTCDLCLRRARQRSDGGGDGWQYLALQAASRPFKCQSKPTSATNFCRAWTYFGHYVATSGYSHSSQGFSTMGPGRLSALHRVPSLRGLIRSRRSSSPVARSRIAQRNRHGRHGGRRPEEKNVDPAVDSASSNQSERTLITLMFRPPLEEQRALEQRSERPLVEPQDAHQLPTRNTALLRFGSRWIGGCAVPAITDGRARTRMTICKAGTFERHFSSGPARDISDAQVTAVNSVIAWSARRRTPSNHQARSRAGGKAASGNRPT
jgi:hypothetical protein